MPIRAIPISFLSTALLASCAPVETTTYSFSDINWSDSLRVVKAKMKRANFALLGEHPSEGVLYQQYKGNVSGINATVWITYDSNNRPEKIYIDLGKHHVDQKIDSEFGRYSLLLESSSTCEDFYNQISDKYGKGDIIESTEIGTNSMLSMEEYESITFHRSQWKSNNETLRLTCNFEKPKHYASFFTQVYIEYEKKRGGGTL